MRLFEPRRSARAAHLSRSIRSPIEQAGFYGTLTWGPDALAPGRNGCHTLTYAMSPWMSSKGGHPDVPCRRLSRAKWLDLDNNASCRQGRSAADPSQVTQLSHEIRIIHARQEVALHLVPRNVEIVQVHTPLRARQSTAQLGY